MPEKPTTLLPEPAQPWAILEDRLPAALQDVWETSRPGVPKPEPAAAAEPMTGGILVLPVKGGIFPKASMTRFGIGLDAFRAQLRAAQASPDVSTIVLDIDSPGGMVDGLQETSELLRAVAKEKPVIAYTESLAASAAYYLAAQAGEIVAGRDAMVGSIGTLVVHGDFSKAYEDFGIKVTIIRDPERKAEGNSFEPLTDAARERFQEIVSAYSAQFHADVAKGRGVPVSTVRSAYGQGTLLLSREARTAGMVDRIESMDVLLYRLTRSRPAKRARAGGDEVLVMAEYSEPLTLTADDNPVPAVDPKIAEGMDAQEEAERARALDLDFRA